MKRWSVSVAVGNIKGNPLMSQPKVRSDAHVLSALAEVVLAVEIKIARYNRAMYHAAKAHAQKVYFEKHPNQISAPEAWTKTHKKHHRLSKGDATIPNPGRELDILFDDETKTAYGVMHLTNGAWNPKRKPRKKARQKLWLKQVAEARKIIAHLHSLGWTVVVGGDFNTGPMMPHVELHADQQVVNRAGLMWLVVIPAEGVTVKVFGKVTKTRGLYTDHPFIRATLQFEQAA